MIASNETRLLPGQLIWWATRFQGCFSDCCRHSPTSFIPCVHSGIKRKRWSRSIVFRVSTIDYGLELIYSRTTTTIVAHYRPVLCCPSVRPCNPFRLWLMIEVSPSFAVGICFRYSWRRSVWLILKIISVELLFSIRRQSIAVLAACGWRPVVVSGILPRLVTQGLWHLGPIESRSICTFGFVGPHRKCWEGIIPSDCVRRYRGLIDPISS